MTSGPDGTLPRDRAAALAAVQTPCLLVDLQVVRGNLARMRQLLDGELPRWRPHVKTCKVPEVLDLLRDAGLRQFKCATTREAEVLLARCLEPVDLLIALAHRGSNLARLAALAAEHPQHRLSVLTEDPEHAAAVRQVAPALGLFVDIDPDWGRSGIALRDRARQLATARACGTALRGVHCYEGHVRGTVAARRAACATLYGELLTAVDALPDGHALELVTSGTPAFPFALADERLRARRHQVSPGTVVYWDGMSAAWGIDGFTPAVSVLATVISAPRENRVTCDAGSKALDAACGDPCANMVGYPHLRACTPSEEHLPLERAAPGPMPRPGQRVELVPRHVCPTVNLADDALLLDGDRCSGLVPVRARGHDNWPRSNAPQF